MRRTPVKKGAHARLQELIQAYKGVRTDYDVLSEGSDDRPLALSHVQSAALDIAEHLAGHHPEDVCPVIRVLGTEIMTVDVEFSAGAAESLERVLVIRAVSDFTGLTTREAKALVDRGRVAFPSSSIRAFIKELTRQVEGVKLMGIPVADLDVTGRTITQRQPQRTA